MRRTTAVVVVATMAWFLCGCGAARPSKYYQLTVPSPINSDSPSPTYAITLLIAPITASHLYRSDRVVYSTGSEMGTYEHQRWAEPPTEMLGEMLIRQLRESGRYRAVYAQGSSSRGDYLVRGHLYDFKEVSSPGVLARVTIELELRDLKTGTTVWTHFYTHDEPVERKDVSGVIAALDRNTHRGIGEFTASLNQYFARHATQSQISRDR